MEAGSTPGSTAICQSTGTPWMARTVMSAALRDTNDPIVASIATVSATPAIDPKNCIDRALINPESQRRIMLRTIAFHAPGLHAQVPRSASFDLQLAGRG